MAHHKWYITSVHPLVARHPCTVYLRTSVARDRLARHQLARHRGLQSLRLHAAEKMSYRTSYREASTQYANTAAGHRQAGPEGIVPQIDRRQQAVQKPALWCCQECMWSEEERYVWKRYPPGVVL